MASPTADQGSVVAEAGSGMGRVIASALAGEGASLCLLGQRQPVPDLLAEEARPAKELVQSYGIVLSSDDASGVIRSEQICPEGRR